MKKVILSKELSLSVHIDNCCATKLYVFEDNGIIYKLGLFEEEKVRKYAFLSFNTSMFFSVSVAYDLHKVIEVAIENGHNVLEFDNQNELIEWIITIHEQNKRRHND